MAAFGAKPLLSETRFARDAFNRQAAWSRINFRDSSDDLWRELFFRTGTMAADC